MTDRDGDLPVVLSLLREEVVLERESTLLGNREAFEEAAVELSA